MAVTCLSCRAFYGLIPKVNIKIEPETSRPSTAAYSPGELRVRSGRPGSHARADTGGSGRFRRSACSRETPARRPRDIRRPEPEPPGGNDRSKTRNTAGCAVASRRRNTCKSFLAPLHTASCFTGVFREKSPCTGKDTTAPRRSAESEITEQYTTEIKHPIHGVL